LYQNCKYIIVVTGASYLMGNGGFFPGQKAAGVWGWLLTSI